MDGEKKKSPENLCSQRNLMMMKKKYFKQYKYANKVFHVAVLNNIKDGCTIKE